MVVEMPVRMTSLMILGTRTAREDEDTLNGLLLPFKFALWFFSPMPFTWKLKDRKI
jgi:hypothetical protein